MGLVPLQPLGVDRMGQAEASVVLAEADDVKELRGLLGVATILGFIIWWCIYISAVMPVAK